MIDVLLCPAVPSHPQHDLAWKRVFRFGGTATFGPRADNLIDDLRRGLE